MILKELIQAATFYYLEGRNFRGTNVRAWQVQKLQTLWNLFSWLDLYRELHGIYFRNGQIWKFAKGNNENINDMKGKPFSSKLSYIKLITIFKVLHLRTFALLHMWKYVYTKCDKPMMLFYFFSPYCTAVRS